MADDRRVALAALAVTAVVGVASPLLAWVSSRDVQDRAARETRNVQERAAREARHQSDLSELRFVLDTALTDLNAVEARARTKRRVWRDWRDAKTDQEHVERAQDALDRAVAKSRAAGDRIRIRLGQRAAYKVYWFAYEQFEEVGVCTPITPPLGDPDARHLATKDLHDLGRDYRHVFSDLAFMAVRSQLRRSEPWSPSAWSRDLASTLVNKGYDYLTTCAKAQA